jgi:iron complex outermembrane receptor protein
MGVYKALLLAGCAGTIITAAPAVAQDSGEEEAESSIVVTGSRIVRPDYVSNSPAVTVDEALLENSSTAALESNLNKLPQFTPAQTPTAGGDIQPTATNTPGAATISLRGLGANRTLVLLDGRRATPGNASMVVDISTIPSAAIERAEIISGGASATYGADAVAGVTNFILKKNFQGLELDGQIGLSQEGDGFEYQFSGIMGTDFPDGRGNISLAMSMNTREASYQRDRKWYREMWADPSTTSGQQFFLDNAGVSIAGVDPDVFFDIFDQAIPTVETVDLRDPSLDPTLASSYTCNVVQDPRNIGSGICVPVVVAPGVAINVLSGIQAFSVYANPDGTAFTNGFNQRGGVSRFNQNIDNYNYKITDAGTLVQNNTDLYLTLPLTRYNFFARGNYEINDWVGVFGQALFSHVETYTRNEGSPIVGGWSANLPYGTDVYTGNTQLGIPSSLNTDGTTNAAYLTGGQFGLNCPATGGCPKYVVFPLPAEFEELMLSRTNPNADVSLNYLFPEERETFTDVNTYTIIAGLEGSIPGTDWTWEAFVNHGESSTFARQTGVNSLARMRALFQMPNWGQGMDIGSNPGSGQFGANFASCTSGYNIFSSDPVSQDCKDAIKADLKNRSTIRQTIVEANLQGGLFELPAGDLRFALGASYREADFEFINDTLTSQGVSFLDQAQGIYPSGDTFGFIDVKEVYGELLIPVLADVPFIQEFNLEVGGRMSHYNTTGTSWTYKILGDWSVNDWLRFRGGFNRAERAPNIGELFLAPQQTFAFNTLGDICSQRSVNRVSANDAAAGAALAADVRAVCSAVMDATAGAGQGTIYYGQPVAQQPAPGGGFAFPTLVGNAALRPETADTWTAGMVIQSPMTGGPLSRLRLSVDWFNVKIKDAIGFSPGATIQQCFDPFFNPLVTGAAGSASQAQAAAAAAACDGVAYQPGPFAGSAPGIGNIVMTYTNSALIDVSGIDAQIDWATDIGPGTLTANVVASYLLHYKVAELASNPLVDYSGTQGTTAGGLNSGNSYEYRIFGTLGYNVGPARIALQWQHLPAVEDAAEAVQGATPITGAPSYNVFALQGNYQLTDDIGLRFGVDNLFDKAPPRTGINTANTSPATNGQLPGGGIGGVGGGLYDTLGRRFYLGGNIRF